MTRGAAEDRKVVLHFHIGETGMNLRNAGLFKRIAGGR